jgi:hypothetical protein
LDWIMLDEEPQETVCILEQRIFHPELNPST